MFRTNDSLHSFCKQHNIGTEELVRLSNRGGSWIIPGLAASPANQRVYTEKMNLLIKIFKHKVDGYKDEENSSKYKVSFKKVLASRNMQLCFYKMAIICESA